MGGKLTAAEACRDPNVRPSWSTLYDGRLKRPGICLNCGRETDDSRKIPTKDPGAKGGES